MSSDLFSYDFYSIAHQHLRDTLGSDKAEFKADQLEAILSIVEHRKKLLLVQRTGWGKSMVYFIATKILRDPEYYSLHLGFENKSPGTVLMISPLLSLMRNQVLEGSSIIEIGRIDSSINQDERDHVAEKFLNSELDMLITTPEQLAKEEFRNNILMPKSSNMSLLIVDEAHCISDWGHDFRPDYMRIRSVISGLPQQTPVIATTATANDRVIEDIVKQMGQSIEVSRGKLTRKSIHLQAFDLPSQEERLALLVDIINEIRLPGIVYVTTTNKTEIVAEWLKQNDIKAKPYTGENSTIDREKIERGS